MVLTILSPTACSSTFLILPRTTCSGKAPPIKSEGPCTLIIHQENTPKTCPENNLMEAIPQLILPFAKWLQLTSSWKKQQTDNWRNQWKLNSTVIQEVQLLLHIFTWIRGHLLEHERPISSQSSINSSSSSPRSYQFSNSFSVEVGTWRTIPSVAVSSWLWLTWYVLMIFHSICLHPLAMST